MAPNIQLQHRQHLINCVMNNMPHATAEGDQSLTTRSSFSENRSNSNGSSVVGNNNNNGMAANQAEYYNKMNYLMKLSEETHELERRYNMLQSSSDGSNNANDAADKGKAKAGYDKVAEFFVELIGLRLLLPKLFCGKRMLFGIGQKKFD